MKQLSKSSDNVFKHSIMIYNNFHKFSFTEVFFFIISLTIFCNKQYKTNYFVACLGGRFGDGWFEIGNNGRGREGHTGNGIGVKTLDARIIIL